VNWTVLFTRTAQKDARKLASARIVKVLRMWSHDD
jgi:hypothetical protein